MLPAMFSGIGGEVHTVNLTLYTDTHIVRASYATRQRRVSDILNESETDFIVVRDASFDDFGTSTQPMRAEYAQINLGAVLFAVVSDHVDPVPELRTPKVAERALISIPPFRVVGSVHILPERNLQESLEELTGRFLPVTDAQFWSDRVGEARQNAAMVAVNHARAQILAPHRETDPWAGLDRAGEESAVPPAESIATDEPAQAFDSIRVAGGNAEGWPDSDFDR
jgi:hypothetical protein